MQRTERKEINKLDHVVTNNKRKNKNQHNGLIENEPKFDNKFVLSRDRVKIKASPFSTLHLI